MRGISERVLLFLWRWADSEVEVTYYCKGTAVGKVVSL